MRKIQGYHSTILDAIQKSGAAMSLTTGIGKMFAPWLKDSWEGRNMGTVCTEKLF